MGMSKKQPSENKYNKPFVRPGSAMISMDLLNKAKELAQTPNIMTKDDYNNVEKLVGKSSQEIDFNNNIKQATQTKSNFYKKQLEDIDNQKRQKAQTAFMNKKKQDMPEFRLNYIDEVKVMKSKKNELVIANENFKLKNDLDLKKRKQVLTEVKNDMQTELFVINKMKQQQEHEKNKRDERVRARKVLDNQIDENYNKRQQAL